MSNVIHMLPDAVANQIAAGEVIQRPASVIKELAENAIDAGATDIKIIVKDAGRTLIQVIDNGCGMSETDARMAFERHATSKISQVTDLYALHTMGFRGEALPSIAAVAQVELLTRREDDELGVKIEIAGSKVNNQEPIATAIGSQFCVRNLFFNIPARRAFLKSDAAEMRHVTSEFLRVALAHPNVAISLNSNGTPLYILPQGNMKQRVSAIVGKALAQELVPIDVETSIVTIKGFIGTPDTARKSGADQFFFANDRYMRSPYFHKAVVDAYKNIIPPDQTPAYFIYFTVDPRSLDVNVHPQKTEIKFEEESAIWQTLNASVRDSLGKYNIMPSLDFDNADAISIPTFIPNQEVTEDTIQSIQNSDKVIYNPFEHETIQWNDDNNKATTERSFTSRINSHNNNMPTHSQINGWENMYQEIYSDHNTRNEQTTYLSRMNQPANKENTIFENVPEKETSQNLYFQYAGKYIVTPVRNGLMFIDQHRAHERIQYEIISKQMSQGQNYSQKLIFPEIVPLSTEDACIIEEISAELELIGMELTYDSENGHLNVSAIPSQIDATDVSSFIELLLFDIRNGEVDVQNNLQEYVIKTLASKSAMPYGKQLSPEEMQALSSKLFATQAPSVSPSGKKIFIIIDNAELDNRF